VCGKSRIPGFGDGDGRVQSGTAGFELADVTKLFFEKLD